MSYDGRIRRTTPAQALAGVITAEAAAGRERIALDLHVEGFQDQLDVLAAKPCAAAGCGHRMDHHGGITELRAFRAANACRDCPCGGFTHGR